MSAEGKVRSQSPVIGKVVARECRRFLTVRGVQTCTCRVTTVDCFFRLHDGTRLPEPACAACATWQLESTDGPAGRS